MSSIPVSADTTARNNIEIAFNSVSFFTFSRPRTRVCSKPRCCSPIPIMPSIHFRWLRRFLGILTGLDFLCAMLLLISRSASALPFSGLWYPLSALILPTCTPGCSALSSSTSGMSVMESCVFAGYVSTFMGTFFCRRLVAARGSRGRPASLRRSSRAGHPGQYTRRMSAERQISPGKASQPTYIVALKSR